MNNNQLKSFAIILLGGIALMGCSEKKPDLQSEAIAADHQPESTASSATDFDSRMRELSQDYFALRPEIATFLGYPDERAGARTMNRLGNYSIEGERQRREGLKSILANLAAIDKSTLSDRQLISLRLVETEARNAYAPAEAVEYGMILGDLGNWFMPYPVSHMSGPHLEIPMILEDKMAIRSTGEAVAYLDRLADFDGVLDDLIDKLEHDRALGVIPPDFSIDRTVEALSDSISIPATEHALVTSFNRKMTDAGIGSAAEQTQRAVTLVGEKIYPAMQRLIDALTTLRPLASHDPGVGRLPGGEAFYQAMITHMTDTTLAADEIHAIGLVEVERIQAEMDQLLKSIGHVEGTVGARMGEMLKDPQYIYPNTAEGKKQLIADMTADLALANARLPLWFGHLPDQAVAIKAVPKHREQSVSGAFYDPPSLDGSRPGIFWVSLFDTATTPSYSLQTLTYHEANPGHHLQIILGLDESLPILNTIFFSNAAGEGWATYAEFLASEMGLYENDPVDDLGRLQQELHRAVRLVVDTGMHAMGWTREQAIEYTVATEGIHIIEATDETDRYAVWPGQALGYKLGMLKILELRKRAQQQLGDRFDIRSFHDRLLEEGALPLNLMEEKIDKWIAGRQLPHAFKAENIGDTTTSYLIVESKTIAQ